MKKKIVYLTTGLDCGGAEMQVVLLAEIFQEKGWDVSVVSMLSPTTPLLSQRLERARIPFYSLKMKAGIPGVGGLIKLVTLLREIDPLVLHCHMVHANILGRVSRLFYRVPVLICTAHNTFEGGGWRNWAYRWTDFLCDLTTNVSPGAVQIYLQKKLASEKKIRFVPDGIDTKSFFFDVQKRISARKELGLLDGEFVWLAVGRLEEQKNYPLMIKAFAKLSYNYPQSRLFIAGRGSLEGALAGLIEQLGLREKVTLLGLRDDIPSLMNAADALILTSHYEGFALVLAEAAHCGLPIVATESEGPIFLSQYFKTIRLAKNGDMESVYKKMAEVMKSGGRYKLPEGNRDLFSIEQVYSVWEEIIEDCIAKYLC